MKSHSLGLSTDKWPFAGIVFGLVISGVLSFVSLARISEFQEHAAWVGHTHQVRYSLQQTVTLANEAIAGTRGFVITGRADFLSPYKNAVHELPVQLGRLNPLLQDNPAQLEKLTLLESLVDRFLGLLTRAVALHEENLAPTLAGNFIRQGQGEEIAKQIRALVADMEHEEAKLLTQREQRMSGSLADTRRLLISGTIVAFLLFGASFTLLVRAVLQRRRADQAVLAANVELQLRATELEQANKELESFSYSVSHDLRIPLRAVSGYSSMLAEDYESLLDEEGKRLLNIIRENSKRMGLLIDDLLAFSRLGRQTITFTQVDMNALVENVVDEVRARYPESNAALTVENLPMASGDRALLRQTWINLISNAFKYSGKNAQAEIRISGTCDGALCTYAVRDNGIGFDMQYYEKLFGVFQRLHSGDEFPGTGVGLAIVQRVISRHGGRVWAESAINQGTTFFFTLPQRELT